jgi:hypothetical protein
MKTTDKVDNKNSLNNKKMMILIVHRLARIKRKLSNLRNSISNKDNKRDNKKNSNKGQKINSLANKISRSSNLIKTCKIKLIGIMLNKYRTKIKLRIKSSAKRTLKRRFKVHNIQNPNKSPIIIMDLSILIELDFTRRQRDKLRPKDCLESTRSLSLSTSLRKRREEPPIGKSRR